MEMICLWMNHWANIDISFLCPAPVELRALHLSKHLTATTYAVCLCGYLVLSHEVNRGLWGSPIEILHTRCAHIHRDASRSQLVHKPHATIFQFKHTLHQLNGLTTLSCPDTSSDVPFLGEIFVLPSSHRVWVESNELDLSDKHVLPLPLENWLALHFKDLTWASCDVGWMFPLNRGEDPCRWRDEGNLGKF